MTLGALVTAILGVSRIPLRPGYFLSLEWMRIKLVLATILMGDHGCAFVSVDLFPQDRNFHSTRWYFIYKDFHTPLLIGSIPLEVFKP